MWLYLRLVKIFKPILLNLILKISFSLNFEQTVMIPCLILV